MRNIRAVFKLRCGSTTHPKEREWEGLSLFVIKYLQAAAFIHTHRAQIEWERGRQRERGRKKAVGWRKRKGKQRLHRSNACYLNRSVFLFVCVCVAGWDIRLHTSCVGKIGLYPDTLRPSTFKFSLPTPHSSPPVGGAPAGPMMKEEGLLSRRRFSTCGGTASLRPPRLDGRKLIRNASFGGYNELSPISLPGGCTMAWNVSQSSTLGSDAGLLVGLQMIDYFLALCPKYSSCTVGIGLLWSWEFREPP